MGRRPRFQDRRKDVCGGRARARRSMAWIQMHTGGFCCTGRTTWNYSCAISGPGPLGVPRDKRRALAYRSRALAKPSLFTNLREIGKNNAGPSIGPPKNRERLVRVARTRVIPQGVTKAHRAEPPAKADSRSKELATDQLKVEHCSATLCE